MATDDRSRVAFSAEKRYTGVGWQMGRIPTDDDLNDLEAIRREDGRRERVEVVGPFGSPDGGFRISDPQIVGGRLDFRIGDGTLYLGGLRLERPEAERFVRQTDWLRNPGAAPPAAERTDLVYVEAWEQTVSAVEDEELFEVGLGGPDTTTRIRTVARVRVREDVGTEECHEAWDDLADAWEADGLGTLGLDHQLVPDTTLTVGFAPGGDPDDLCSPTAVGGYLGADNQAIRVRLLGGNTFTWGFDNGAPLYRVRLAADRQRVLMDSEPRDQAHWPLAGQVVELIPWSAVLPSGEKLAEEPEPGHLARVQGSFDPDGPDGPQIVLAAAVPAGFGEEWNGWGDDPADLLETRFGREAPQQPYFFLRVWDRGPDTASPLAIPIAADVPLGSTGLTVTFGGADRRPGDHWTIAARPHTPDRAVPWGLEVGRRPDGVRRWVAPLALVRWWQPGDAWLAEVHDCRQPFRPLTRLRTCCTVTVGDGTHSFGDFTSIQAAVDALPPTGGEVCVLPGRYRESVRIVGLTGVTVRGCGRRSRVLSPEGVDLPDPVFEVRDSEEVRLLSLAIEAGPGAPGVLVAESGWDPDAGEPPGPRPLRDVELQDLRINASTRGALEARGGRRIRIRGCSVWMEDAAGEWPAVTLAGEEIDLLENEIRVAMRADSEIVHAGLGGVWIRGASAGVRVERNRIQGGIGHGITLGDVLMERDGQLVFGIIGWIYYDPADPCNPCKPGTVIIVGQPQGDDGVRYVPGYPLREIRIVDNRILDMGMSGISVLGFFPDDADGQITVLGLWIERNEIRHCLRRSLADFPDAVGDRAAFGGVVVADVEDLVIRENRIERNGPDRLDPLCGIFALTVEGLEIHHNRILENGAETGEPAAAARPGARGGIVVRMALATTFALDGKGRYYPTARGVPAARIHENVVVAPLGRALTLLAMGPVSVQDNQLTSHGVEARGLGRLAATVLIVNLGASQELLVAGVDLMPAATLLSGGLAGGGGGGGSVAATHLVAAPTTRTPWRLLIPNGNTLFHGNQLILDLFGVGAELALTSATLISLDDLAVEDNQSDCVLLDDIVLIDTIAGAAGTVRVLGNRFKETPGRTFFSLASLALLINTTAHNQATHCFLIWSGLHRVATGNVTLNTTLCGRFTD